MAAEVPGNVLIAIRLMYVGFVVTALDLVFSLQALGRYTLDAKAAQRAATKYTAIRDLGRAANQTAIRHSQDVMAGAMVIGVIAAALGLICWACLAVAARRGSGRTRIAGTLLLAIYSICALLVLFVSHGDPGAQFTTIVVWAIVVAAVIPLWSQQARDFFYAWRKR
jgi:drug/metabolite transporter (DMT)-like permease